MARRACAVDQSFTTSMPIEEPPYRGLTMYGPGKSGSGAAASSATRGSTGTPAAARTPVVASLSIPRAAAAALGPL